MGFLTSLFKEIRTIYIDGKQFNNEQYGNCPIGPNLSAAAMPSYGCSRSQLSQHSMSENDLRRESCVMRISDAPRARPVHGNFPKYG